MSQRLTLIGAVPHQERRRRMSQRLTLIGAFCIALMAFWVTGAQALYLSGGSLVRCPWPKQLVNGVCQSPILVDLSWGGIGNADKTLTYFEVVLTANTSDANYPTRIYFHNPAENTGGTSSTNFWNFTITPVTNVSPLAPFITGKGKADSKTIFGDCDRCDALDENGNPKFDLPDEGKLWFLFDRECRDSYDPIDTNLTRENWLDIINCIKMDLVERFAPNTSWWPYAVEIDSIDVNIRAYRDGVLAVTGDFFSCKVNSQNEYICDITDINNKP